MKDRKIIISSAMFPGDIDFPGSWNRGEAEKRGKTGAALSMLRPDSAPCTPAATPVFHIRGPDEQLFIQGKKPPRVRFGHEDIHTVSKEIKQVGAAETDDFAHFENPSDDSRVVRRPTGYALARKRARSRIAAAGPDPPCGENAVASLSSLMHNSCQMTYFRSFLFDFSTLCTNLLSSPFLSSQIHHKL